MERSRPNLYRVLQVDPSANQLVIQAAYRVLAQIFHPDVAGDADEMKRLNAAWEVLGDPKRRRQYDIERAGQHPGAAALHAASGTTPSAAAARDSAATAAATAGTGAGPPPGRPFGPVLRLGRYDGWSLGEVLRVDRPFLEWLRNAPQGRGLRDEIDAVLVTKKGPGAVDERRHYETNQRQARASSAGAPTKPD